MCLAWALCVLSPAAALSGASTTAKPAATRNAPRPRPLPLRLRGGGGADIDALPKPDTQRLKELGKCSGRVPYRRKRFNGDENPILELAHGILGFAKGLGAFFLISGVSSVCYAMAAGPKRKTPPPVRTTTGLPYQPGDAPTGK